MGRIVHHFRKIPGEPVNKSRFLAATVCRDASCVRNSVVNNSPRPVCDMSAHLRTFSLVPMEQWHAYFVDCDPREKPGGKYGRSGQIFENSLDPPARPLRAMGQALKIWRHSGFSEWPVI
jgi:hypothetical protein